MMRRLAVEEGVLGGSSSGSAVVAALAIAARLGTGKRVVTIIPGFSRTVPFQGPVQLFEVVSQIDF